MKNNKTMINVIFDAAGGKVSTESREAICGECLGALPCPVRAGYTFVGWYLGETPVTEDFAVSEECDLRLTAHWVRAERRRGASRSMLKKQKLATAILAGVTAFLLVALFVVNYIVAIFPVVDVWYGDDGTEYSEKYHVKKKNGVYGLYNKDGELMEVNSDGYYIAKASGNQYSIDAETGECTLYAVVDYDAASGESLSANRVMIFPQITQTNIYSIKVDNKQENYSYTFSRDEEGNMRIVGTEESLATYDATLFAQMCVNCGYPLSIKRLDFSEGSDAPRLEDGSIDYSAYGLADVYDETGALTYTPTTYTIQKAIYEGKTCSPDPNVSYTVKVGDALLSGGGYYVQLVGRDTVYIVGTGLGETVLQPIEALVTPMATYPVGVATHTMIDEFLLGTVDFEGDLSNLKDFEDMNVKSIVNFAYEDIELRINTLFTSTPYISQMELENYRINPDSVDRVLFQLYEMKYLSCKKLGLTKSALEEYGFSGEVFYLTYGSPVTDGNGTITGYMENQLLISPKTDRGTYYIASFTFDMIVEVDRSYLPFLEWDQNIWYAKNVFGDNIAYVKKIDLEIGGKTFSVTIDNSGSDQKEQISSANMKLFCEQYYGGKKDPHELDYTITYTYLNDVGVEKTAQVSALDNFRAFYLDFLHFSIIGDFDEKEEQAFYNKHGMDVDAYIAQGDAVCDAIIYLSVEDLASTLNTYTYKDENGKVLKYYEENNTRDIVVRLYRYSEGHCYLTLETIKEFDQDGNPISDPKKANGAFFVLNSDIELLLSDLEMLLDGQPIAPKGEVIEIVK